jgi:branched-chain amino acid transport system ATP-binding protein
MSRFALEIKQLCKNFGPTKIIKDLELSVPKGERVAIIGPNGAGKSTLFNLISGYFAPSSGEILLSGVPIQGRKPYEINRLGLSRSFQISSLFGNLTVTEHLACSALWSLGKGYLNFKLLKSMPDVSERVSALLQSLNLERKSHVQASQLSYAEQRALEIGVTLGSESDVILLDEPTAGMSNSETAYFVDLIKAVTKDKTLLTVEHDMGVVFGLADKIAVLVYGQIIAYDTPERIRANPLVQEAYLGVAPE